MALCPVCRRHPVGEDRSHGIVTCPACGSLEGLDLQQQAAPARGRLFAFDWAHGSVSPFVASEDAVVAAALRAAARCLPAPPTAVGDLGCGDGKVVIAAAASLGCPAWGLDLDASLLDTARRRAADAGVAHLTDFRRADITALGAADLPAPPEGSVLVVYLLPDALRKLAGLLGAAVRAGAVVVAMRWPVPGLQAHETSHEGFHLYHR